MDIAEKKLGNSQEGMAYLNFLRGRLLAIKQSPFGNRAMPQCAEHYKKAIDLGYNKPFVLYYWGMHNKAWKNKELAISQFEQILNLVGTDSELGIEAAKELEKVKVKKSGGCFIATAVYGSDTASDVLLLRRFRDTVLLPSRIGNIFVNIYYLTSPPLAKAIASNPFLRKIFRKSLIQPTVNLCRSCLTKN